MESGESSIPASNGFLFDVSFLKISLVSAAMAVLLALVALSYLNCIDQVQRKWASCSYKTDRNCGDWYHGELYWIGISSGSGLLIGLIRYAFQYPDNLPSIFEEISSGYVHPEWSILTFLLSLISLCGGATLGPERALSNIGGGLATFFANKWNIFEDKDDRKLVVLGAIAACISTVLPSPMLSVLMIHELTHPSRSYIESLTLLTIPATVCWIVYYGFLHFTYLSHLSSASAIISGSWTAHGGYKPWMITTGLLVGIASVALSLMIILSMG